MKIRFAVQPLWLPAVLLVFCAAPFALAQQAVSSGSVQNTAVAATPGAAPLSAQPATRSGEEAESTAPQKDTGGGVKIHGHWVLQVRNPDGTLGERREFNNSLVTGPGCSSTTQACKYVSGDQMLAAILSGDLTPGGLGITLITGPTGGLDPTTFCPVNTNEASPPAGIGCYSLLDYKTLLFGWPYGNAFLYGLGSLGTITSPVSGGYQLGLTTSVSFAPQASIVLSGNFQVGCTDGGPYASITLTCGGTMNPITAVQTYMAGCGNATNVFGTSYSAEAAFTSGFVNSRFTGANQPDLQAGLAPATCTETNETTPVAVIMGILTSTSLPNGPLTVTTGQVITVTVTISFS